MAKSFQFLAKTEQQLRNFYNEKKRLGKNGFENFDDFKNWYDEQTKVCHYCKLTETESQQIAVEGLLRSKRFPKNGLHGRGTSRAMWLEIDRYDPDGIYSRANCVMACYFCNNDKSDVFHGDDYMEFIKDRNVFLTRLIQHKNNNK